jgi:hypothetical protein
MALLGIVLCSLGMIIPGILLFMAAGWMTIKK